MKKTLLALTILAACGSAHADVRINGFANLIAGKTSSDGMLYGYDDDISLSPESLFAVQLSGDVNDKLTATGQLVARGSDDYDVDFEWAYFTYAATDNVSVSAGRLRLPLFRYSASLDVGYSYHWVAAPQSVYGVPFNNIDGVRVDYSNYAGDWEYNVQVTAGTFENNGYEITPGTIADIEGNNAIVGSIEATYEWFKVRATAGSAKSSLSIESIDALIGQLAMISAPLADKLAFNDDSSAFYGIGVEIDQFDWFVSAEWTSIDIEESFNPQDVAYYITAGIRHGKFTPSITYEKLDGNDDVKFLSDVAALPEQVRGPAAMIVGGVQQAVMEETSTVTLGLRYDFDTNVALKADISRSTDDIDDDNDTTLVRVAVNYIF
ncbi:topoisomerase IV [Alteromonas sp. H39]|uniref:topoisomerase IV n=1 Tax=Alteromonas sp. H39 TaxID=3389876 RepID=UPI0039DFA3DB